jgi:hypothetical protein
MMAVLVFGVARGVSSTPCNPAQQRPKDVLLRTSLEAHHVRRHAYTASDAPRLAKLVGEISEG